MVFSGQKWAKTLYAATLCSASPARIKEFLSGFTRKQRFDQK
jgi:hypothetical protein